jgi:hypothetical protein
MTSGMIRIVIQRGLLVLVALMPFHAFLSVWLGSLIGHQAIIQSWKEVLLLVLAGMAVALLIKDPEARDRLRTWPPIFAGAFAVIAAVVTLATRPSLTADVFGAKTDFEFLLAFILAIIIATPRFVRFLIYTVLISSAVVITFGILQIYALPSDFLMHFGYNSTTILPYQTLDPATNNLRYPATLGGANQLGTFLILPMALGIILAIRRRQWGWLVLSAAAIPVLLHTFSRGAWLGALAAAVVIALLLVPARWRAGVAAVMAATGLLVAVAIKRLLDSGGNLQYYIFHGSTVWDKQRGSDYEHLQSLTQGVNYTLDRPLGHGLGTAGPAVFHSGTGVIIENYYLQLSYETGIIGLVTFLAILASTAWTLARRAAHGDLAAASLAALIGVCVTALVLPAWADSSTAIILWTAAGSAIGLTPGGHRV